MGKGRSPWQDGRRAWERLNGWHQDAPAATPGHPDDGHGALAALGDIGLVRRLLEQAELVSVRVARRHGMSWAEIATKLGVTRQSAWERWHELDDRASDASTAAPARVAESVDAAASELVLAARRRSTVRVPNVIGRTWDDARQTLLAGGLVAVGADPDGPPLAIPGWPDAVVSDQSPESGAKVPPGSAVRLWLERGGGGGVREPRRTPPAPRAGREVHPDPVDESVTGMVS